MNVRSSAVNLIYHTPEVFSSSLIVTEHNMSPFADGTICIELFSHTYQAALLLHDTDSTVKSATQHAHSVACNNSITFHIVVVQSIFPYIYGWAAEIHVATVGWILFIVNVIVLELSYPNLSLTYTSQVFVIHQDLPIVSALIRKILLSLRPIFQAHNTHHIWYLSIHAQ